MADTATLTAPAKVLGPLAGRAGEILTPEALAFLAELHRRFDARRLELLDRTVEPTTESLRAITDDVMTAIRDEVAKLRDEAPPAEVYVHGA